MISRSSKSFFSGFSMINEKELFNEYIITNNYTISGFSYGAQKAFEYALNTNNRIDKIQLFSPAFFQNKDTKYKRMQLMFFKKDSKSYCDNFLFNCSKPNNIDMTNYFELGTFDELKELLDYEWCEKKLNSLIAINIQIEVYLGVEDKIIDSLAAKNFFTKFATVYFIKDVGHILN